MKKDKSKINDNLTCILTLVRDNGNKVIEIKVSATEYAGWRAATPLDYIAANGRELVSFGYAPVICNTWKE